MARHVAMGGTTTDTIGEHINAITERMLHLKEFVRYARSNGLVNEGNQTLVARIAESALEIRETLKRLTSSKQYSKMVETIEEDAFEVDNTRIAEIRDQFTVKKFEESLEAILPFVAKLAETEVDDLDDTADTNETIVPDMDQVFESYFGSKSILFK